MTGASEANYATNEAPQPRAIKRMVDRLTSPKDSSLIGISPNQVANAITELGNTLF